MTRYVLARQTPAPALTLAQFATATGLDPHEVARAGRVTRLRTGLGLNHTAVGVVLDLLERIDELEAALRTERRGRPRRTSEVIS